jgi:glutamyl-tRNA synthetase
MSTAAPVITRFAPSPTGFLHIGGARTALFNWLFARHHGGIMRLRIEDTDRARSTEEAIAAILDGLAWLGLDWDDEPVYQHRNADRHAEVARALLDQGHAYRCYCSPEELAEMRERAKQEGRAVAYDGTWRDRDPADAPEGVDPVIRFKSPMEGDTVIEDRVQGRVVYANTQLDDLIILRSDGTPTYNLSVVVDDHDMGVTHVIRGDDHLTNAARQSQIFEALGWPVPEFAHIPLIHGPDGAKLSKRHGALGVDAYRTMGYLPEAMRNYLVRLGWSHGDDEIMSLDQMIEWFGLDAIGRAPARFDFDKLASLNGHYIRESDDEDLLGPLIALWREHADFSHRIDALTPERHEQLRRAIASLKGRAKTLVELSEGAAFLFAERPLALDEKASALIDKGARATLAELATDLEAVSDWSTEALEASIRSFVERNDIKLGTVAQPLRAALTGTTRSPGIFEVLELLGRDEALARIADQAGLPA